jgi:multicomponent Na+:H+ antiporter subunit F
MNLFEISLSIAIAALCICMVLILYRFIKGPSLPDRVIALDVFSATLLGVLAIYSIISKVQAYLDVAIVLSLVTFMGTMAFAYYLLQDKNKKR